MKGVIMNNQLKLNFPLPKETFLRVNFIPCRDPEKIIIDAQFNGNRLTEILDKDVVDVSKYMEGKQQRISDLLAGEIRLVICLVTSVMTSPSFYLPLSC